MSHTIVCFSFLFQVSFCFHISAEHPKRDEALNDATSLKDLYKNNNFENSLTTSCSQD